MATKWEKVRYLSRVRPDLEDGRTDECNDSLDDFEAQVKIKDDYSAQTTEDGFKSNVLGNKPCLSRSQPILRARSYDCVRLSVPQDIGRRNTHENAADSTPLRRTSSVYLLLNGHEVDGNIPQRSPSFHKNDRRVLVKDLFTKHINETGKSYALKVRRSAKHVFSYINKLLNQQSTSSFDWVFL